MPKAANFAPFNTLHCIESTNACAVVSSTKIFIFQITMKKSINVFFSTTPEMNASPPEKRAVSLSLYRERSPGKAFSRRIGVNLHDARENILLHEAES